MEAGIETLKQRYQEQIARKQSELQVLLDKLGLLKEIEEERSQLQLNVTPAKYAGKGLTEAIVEAFDSLDGTVTATEVRKHIVRHGFTPAGKNFDVSVYTALRRLVDAGKLEKETSDAGVIYRKA